MSLAGWLNAAWMVKCGGEAAAFRRATRHVARTQAGVLATIVRANRDTKFGRAHHFHRVHDPRSFQRCVPLSDYADYADAVARIAAGEARVLTAEPVALLEPTSGTLGGEKLIPYTTALRRQFQRAVAVWVHDLFRHRPAVRRGRAYWSVSPALGPQRRTAGGIPIGFDDDAAYLGTLERLALDRLLVVPAAAARLPDAAEATYETAKEMGAYLFGFAFFGDTRLFRPQRPFLLTGYVNAACFGLRAGSKLRFRTDVVAVEDFALSGMNAYFHRYLFVDQRFGPRQEKTFANPGGQALHRTAETERRDTAKLRRLFGAAVVEKRANPKIGKTRQRSVAQRSLVVPF